MTGSGESICNESGGKVNQGGGHRETKVPREDKAVKLYLMREMGGAEEWLDRGEAGGILSAHIGRHVSWDPGREPHFPGCPQIERRIPAPYANSAN